MIPTIDDQIIIIVVSNSIQLLDIIPIASRSIFVSWVNTNDQLNLKFSNIIIFSSGQGIFQAILT